MASLKRIRPTTRTELELEAELAEMIAVLEEERSLDAGSTWGDVVKGTNRRRFFIALVGLFFQQYSGVSFMISYGTYYFVLAGSTVGCQHLWALYDSDSYVELFPRQYYSSSNGCRWKYWLLHCNEVHGSTLHGEQCFAFLLSYTPLTLKSLFGAASSNSSS